MLVNSALLSERAGWDKTNDIIRGFVQSKRDPFDSQDFHSLWHAEDLVDSLLGSVSSSFWDYDAKWRRYAYTVDWDATPQKREDVLREHYGTVYEDTGVSEDFWESVDESKQRIAEKYGDFLSQRKFVRSAESIRKRLFGEQ